MSLKHRAKVYVLSLLLASCALPESGGRPTAFEKDQLSPGVGGQSGVQEGSGGQGEVVGGTSGVSGATRGSGGSLNLLATGGDCVGGNSANTGGSDCNCGTGGNANCPVGWDRCDNSGNCIELDSPQHCGACSHSCETPETVNTTNWRCNSGVCTVDTCQKGYANCDGMDSDGCESNLNTDPQHCGGCRDHVCPYPSCSDGYCATAYACGDPYVPGSLSEAPNIKVLLGSVLGVPQTLNQDDAIVSFGAVTSAAYTIQRAKFQMALYDSDSDGMPHQLLVSTASPEYSDTADIVAADGRVEQKLKKPFILTAPGQNTYWIMLWVDAADDAYVITTNEMETQEVRSATNLDAWPSDSAWLTNFRLLAPPSPYLGFFPHMFVMYVPAPIR